LVPSNLGQLLLGCGLGEEVVHAGLSRNRRGGEWVVARDHHGLDAHAAKLCKLLLDAALDDILELHHAEYALVFSYHERRGSFLGDFFDHVAHFLGELAAALLDVALDGVHRALTD
jgi:hypothetical protein